MSKEDKEDKMNKESQFQVPLGILMGLIMLMSSELSGKEQFSSHQFPCQGLHANQVPSQSPSPSQTITIHNGRQTLQKLLRQEDRDGDKKITIEDRKKGHGEGQFQLKGKSNGECLIQGTYYLSNLLQELTLALEKASPQKTVILKLERIFEPPLKRISRQIREIYWDGLTRRIDEEHLLQVIKDEKLEGQKHHYLYVPGEDALAWNYFSEAVARINKANADGAKTGGRPTKGIVLKKLPPAPLIPPNLIPELTLAEEHGLLTLQLEKVGDEWKGVPFVVPGGRFNEMYGWDSYFESVGLLLDERRDLVRAMTENFAYQIRHYGKILNANRSYYLNRSQPPFLTSMIEMLIPGPEALAWKKDVLEAAIKEYHEVWMNPDRLTPTGLSRYFGRGRGIPPEVEPGHFDKVLRPYAKKHGLPLSQFRRKYNAGEIKEAKLEEFFQHDLCVRESGHDTTYRWTVDGQEKCADFVTVDLNTLLYKMELDIADMIKNVFNDRHSSGPSSLWQERARKRRELILKYLWDPQKGLFFDYNYRLNQRSQVLSATTFYPLWTWSQQNPATKILTDDQAKELLTRALPRLEQAGGLAATEDMKHPDDRQWQYPYGWPPHQMILWQGLSKYKLQETLDRLASKWVGMIALNAARYNGTVPEKFNVVTRSHHVFAEYGNVGTKFSYITKEGFGWMNASFQLGLHLLSAEGRKELERKLEREVSDLNGPLIEAGQSTGK